MNIVAIEPEELGPETAAADLAALEQAFPEAEAHVFSTSAEARAYLEASAAPNKLLRARLFGGFEASTGGVPLKFKRRKTQELLALLIDRQGRALSIREACDLLWDGEPYGNKQRSYYQTIVADLRATLKAAGAEEVLSKAWNSLAVVPERIDCDLYRFLDGEELSPGSVRGGYLPAYSWAERSFSPTGSAEVVPPSGFPSTFTPRNVVGMEPGSGSFDYTCSARDLPDLVRRIIAAYYHKDYKPLLDCSCDDVLFIGAGPDITYSKKELVAACGFDAEMPNFHMEDDDFSLSGIDAAEADRLGVAWVTGFYNLLSEGNHGMLTAARQRISVSARWEDGFGWKVFHVHGSNEWAELVGDEVFPVAVSQQTYQYVKRVLKKSLELSNRSGNVRVPGRDATYIVDPTHICWAKASGKSCIVQLAERQETLSCPLGDLEAHLPKADFVRVSRSYLVNAAQATELAADGLHMSDGSLIPVPAQHRATVRRQLLTVRLGLR